MTTGFSGNQKIKAGYRMNKFIKTGLFSAVGIITAGSVFCTFFDFNAAENSPVKLKKYQSANAAGEYAEERSVKDEDDKNYVPFHSIENLEHIFQMPELPTGCEITSLTMVLNYYGINVEKETLAGVYLEKDGFYNNGDDITRGPDYRYVFAGSPDDEHSYGCFPPCIVNAADACLADFGSDMKAKDVSGTSFYSLFDYISEDRPVVLWMTMDLKRPKRQVSWNILDTDEKVTWPSNEHCVVLSAYNYYDNTVTIHDPMRGVTDLSMEDVKKRYDDIGKHAVILL